MANDTYGIKRKAQAFVQSGAGTVIALSNVQLNGELWQVNTLPGALTSGTAQVKLTDADGAVVWTGTAANANAIQADKLTSPVLLSGLYTVTCTYSVSQTSINSNATLIIKSV